MSALDKKVILMDSDNDSAPETGTKLAGSSKASSQHGGEVGVRTAEVRVLPGRGEKAGGQRHR